MSIKIENTVTPSCDQWEAIIRGMRNPKNSWHLSDSYATYIENPETGNVADFEYFIGENDQKLMETLAKGGPVHAKYRRMIPVFVDVTAPIFWWKEFDTYKIGSVRNSCSTMHKIHVKEFSIDDFSHEGCDEVLSAKAALETLLVTLEYLRIKFNETGEKRYWRALIELLPEGFNMRSTLFLNYEVLVGIYRWRKDHKLDEWHTFCDWIRDLPYSELITGEFEEKKDGDDNGQI
jgi:hypothetical protein